jgi:hypothetical protein
MIQYQAYDLLIKSCVGLVRWKLMILREARDVWDTESIGEIKGSVRAGWITLSLEALSEEDQSFLYFKFTLDLTLGH